MPAAHGAGGDVVVWPGEEGRASSGSWNCTMFTFGFGYGNRHLFGSPWPGAHP